MGSPFWFLFARHQHGRSLVLVVLFAPNHDAMTKPPLARKLINWASFYPFPVVCWSGRMRTTLRDLLVGFTIWMGEASKLPSARLVSF